MTDAKKPSEKLMSSVLNGAKVKDELGRTLTLKKPDIMDQYYLARSMGKDSENSQCYAMGINTLFVQEIDGIVVPRPLSENQFLANLSMIKQEGIAAVANFVIENSDVKTDSEALTQIKK